MRGRSRRLRVQALLKPAEGVAVSWRQTTDEVTIRVPVGPDVRGRDVCFEVHPSRLRLDVGGRTLLAGGLADAGGIKVDDCFWVLEDDEGEQSSAGAGGRHVAITLAKAAMGYESWTALLEEDLPDDTITHRVALDIRVGDSLGRLVVGLYGNVVPKTVDNFLGLVSGARGPPLALAGTSFHRIIPGFMAQGGDVTAGDGTGGASIYGPAFPDENFKLKHSGRGVLAMANAGPNTNNSQFYITFTPTPHLDGKHVVFGAVEAGWGTLMRMEGAGSDAGTPVTPVTIVAASELARDANPQAAVDEFDAAAAAAAAEQEEEGEEGGGEEQGGGGKQGRQQQRQQQREESNFAREEALAAQFAAEFDAAAAAGAGPSRSARSSGGGGGGGEQQQ